MADYIVHSAVQILNNVLSTPDVLSQAQVSKSKLHFVNRCEHNGSSSEVNVQMIALDFAFYFAWIQV